MKSRGLTSLIARRYLSSRKSLSVINIISRVSIFAVGVPVAAMVILLSVFNGFDGMVKSMYTSFDPDLMITPGKGKVFETAAVDAAGVRSVEGVEELAYVLEESVLLDYRGRQTIGRIRGVGESYDAVVPIRSLVVVGDYELRRGDMEQALIGQGIAYDLGIRTALYNTLDVYAPRRGEFSSLLPMDAYSVGSLFPEAVFSLDAQTDGDYVIATIEFVQRLLDYEGRATGAAIKLSPGASPESVRREVRETLGDGFDVLTRYEQKASTYRILKYEKWGIFFIVLMVMIIASFSIVGSLMMLIIDKRPDVRTLVTMGADVRFVRRIFSGEGMLISALGIAGGLVVGVAFCVVQQQFGLIKLGGQSFLVDSYPVAMKWGDMAAIVGTTLAVTWIITKFTVSKMIPRTIIRCTA